jgi:hypothetical protein
LEENKLLFWLNSIQSLKYGSFIMLAEFYINKFKDKKIKIFSEQIDKLIIIWQILFPFFNNPNFLDINRMKYLFYFFL